MYTYNRYRCSGQPAGRSAPCLRLSAGGRCIGTRHLAFNAWHVRLYPLEESVPQTRLRVSWLMFFRIIQYLALGTWYFRSNTGCERTGHSMINYSGAVSVSGRCGDRQGRERFFKWGFGYHFTHYTLHKPFNFKNDIEFHPSLARHVYKIQGLF